MKLYTPKREFKVSKLKRANKNEAFSTKFISNPYKGDPWLIALEKQSMEVLSKETGYEPKDIKEIVKIEDVYFEKWYQQLEQKESGFTFDFNRTDPSEMDYSFMIVKNIFGLPIHVGTVGQKILHFFLLMHLRL